MLDYRGIAVASVGAKSAETNQPTVVEQNAQEALLAVGRRLGRLAPNAAMYNTALTCHLGLADAFLTPGEFAHPSGTLGSVVSPAEAGRSGRDQLVTLGAAYEV